MHVLSVKRVLKKLDNIMADRILGGESFRPCKNLSRIEGRLFHRERKSEAEMDNVRRLGIFTWGRVGGGCMRG